MLMSFKNKKLGYQQFAGIAGVLVLWTTISIGMVRAHLGLIDNRPISFLGVYQPTKLLFTFGLVVSGILFLLFASYLAKQYKVRNNFLKYFIIGQVGQIIAGVIPDSPHTTYKIVHTIAGFILAFSLPFLIREFAISQKGSKYKAIYDGLFKLELVLFIIGIGLFISVNGVAPLGEILPTLGFHLWVIALSYISIKSSYLEAAT